MSNNAESYYRDNATAMKSVRESMQDVVKGFSGLHQSVMKAGSLSVLDKELIALAIGVSLRCENCIYSHVKASLKAGASREQILEAVGVAVLMQGGPSYTYLPRVTEALDVLQSQAAE